MAASGHLRTWEIVGKLTAHSMENGMISFEMNDSEQLEIYLDKIGLAELLAQIRLLDDLKTDHVHLMAGSWGGGHLADEPVNPSAKAIRHVKMIVWE